MPPLRNAIAMSVVLRALGADPGEPLTGEEEGAMLANARLLRDATATGQARSLLRDKFIGLLAEDDDGEKAEFFKSAALALGARVAHIRPCLGERSDARVVRETALMLGRLYDAVECHGQPAALVARLREAAAVPVFDELSSSARLAGAFAERLGAGSGIEGRRFVVQVVLMSALH
jgi:ornithine carbamoyltransferase